jgi:hypothetical protein
MAIPAENKKQDTGSRSKNVTENISFGKISFAKDGADEETPKKRKGPTDTLGQIRKIEAKKTKLEQIKSANPEKAQTIEDKEKWGKMLKMAEGETVKDDLKLLKKTLKKKEKIKSKSSKEWNERKDTVRKTMLDKQKKRTDNLKARTESKKNGVKGVKAGGVSKKGGKARPGFEGGVRKKAKK